MNWILCCMAVSTTRSGDGSLLAQGCKPDGGGSHRGQGKVGAMEVHRAVYRKDADGACIAGLHRRSCAWRACRGNTNGFVSPASPAPDVLASAAR